MAGAFRSRKRQVANHPMKPESVKIIGIPRIECVDSEPVSETGNTYKLEANTTIPIRLNNMKGRYFSSRKAFVLWAPKQAA